MKTEHFFAKTNLQFDFNWACYYSFSVSDTYVASDMMFPTKITLEIKNWGDNIKLCFEIQDIYVFFFCNQKYKKIRWNQTFPAA